MKREERNNGRSRFWRGVAAVAIAFSMTVVAATPSNASIGDIWTVPKSALPATVAAAGLTISGAVGIGAGATACIVTVGCGLAVVAGGVLMAIGGASLAWTSTPNADVPEALGTYFIQTPEEYVVSNNGSNYSYVKWSFRLPTAIQDNVAIDAQGYVTYRAQAYECASSCNFFTKNSGQASPGAEISESNTALGGITGFRLQLQLTSGEWTTFDAAPITGYTTDVVDASNVAQVFWQVDDNPQRRLRTETRCTTPDGVSTVNINISGIYTHTGTRPEISPTCTTGSRPTAITVIEEKKPNNSVVWTPSTTVPPIPETPTPACQPGGTGTITCRPGLVLEAVFADEIIDPNWDFAECVTGSDTCNLVIADFTNPNQPIDCGAVNCPGFAAAKTAVESGQTTWQQTNFQCRFRGNTLPMSECDAIQVVAADASLPAPVIPETGGGFACGFNLACYVEELFVPDQYKLGQRANQVRNAFYNTPLGIVPQTINGFMAPFSANTWSPNESNCAGPTLTLPKDMGVDGVNISGDYVIQPLYACQDTDTGKFAANISTYVRGILGPTVYIAGMFMIVNTMLSAIGLALPMFVSKGTTDDR